MKRSLGKFAARRHFVDLSSAFPDQFHHGAQLIIGYFDDQRFGSVGESGEFIGRAWCLGNYERALWLRPGDSVTPTHIAITAKKSITRPTRKP